MDAGIRKMMHELKGDHLNSGDHPRADYHPHTSGFIGTEVLLIEQDKYVLLLLYYRRA